MKYLGIIILTVALLGAAPASANDWRWAKPRLKPLTIKYSCGSLKCIRATYRKEKHRYQRRIARYDRHRRQEWQHWTRLYIPACTWYGESGYGPEYSPVRYIMPNAMGSGAYGKFQFMPTTYHSVAKYHDWSALDQEISARRLFWAQGTAPWANC